MSLGGHLRLYLIKLSHLFFHHSHFFAMLFPKLSLVCTVYEPKEVGLGQKCKKMPVSRRNITGHE